MELEEKEGPVIDFLDDVINNVLDICLPKQPNMDESDYFDTFSNAESNENEPRQDLDDQLRDEDDFEQQISKTVDQFNQDFENLTIDIEDFFRKEINTIIDLLFKEHKINLTNTEYFENEIYDLLSNVWKESGDGEHSDRNKNEILSVSKMGPNEELESIRKTNEKSIFHHGEQDHENGHAKRNIYFAEPNTELLSNADELWPQDILANHVLRPSASVTKSIISLGKLWERDEKYMTPSQTDNSVNNLEKTDEDGNSHDTEVLKSILQDGDLITEHTGDTDLSGKLLKDIKILKSLTSLAKSLPDDEKQTLNEATHDITEKLNTIYAVSQAELSKSIMSLAQTLKDDENIEINEEANALIPEILNQLTGDIPDVEVTKSIATLLNTLRSNHAIPAEDTKASLFDKLAELTDEFMENKVITKSIASLVRAMETDVEHLKTTHDLDDSEETMSHKSKADKSDADSQTEQLKKLEIVVLEPTTINSLVVDSTPPIVKDVKKAHVQTERQDEVKIKDLSKEVTNDTIKKHSDRNDQWKVNLGTAPSWITQANAHGDPSEETVPRAILTQNDIRKWCKDLSKGYKNLEIWRDWLSSTCKEATSILKKKNSYSGWTHKNAKNMLKLRYNISKDAALWHRMNRCTHDTFGSYRRYYGINEIIIPKETKRRRCICKDKYL